MSDVRMRVRKLTTEDAETWSKVGDHQIFGSDIVDQGTDQRPLRPQAGHGRLRARPSGA